MRKAWIVVIISVLFLAVGTWVYAQEAMEKSAEEPVTFGGIVVGNASASATVEDIDVATRMVTLKNELGETSAVECGPEVKNFDQIKKGDKVSVNVSQFAEATVMKDTNAPLSREEETEVSGAPLGQKPAGTITNSVKVMAVVEDIDYANRLVTLKGPERTMTVEASPEVKNFDKVKKGDNVYLELTEKTDIAVTAP